MRRAYRASRQRRRVVRHRMRRGPQVVGPWVHAVANGEDAASPSRVGETISRQAARRLVSRVFRCVAVIRIRCFAGNIADRDLAVASSPLCSGSIVGSELVSVLSHAAAPGVQQLALLPHSCRCVITAVVSSLRRAHRRVAYVPVAGYCHGRPCAGNTASPAAAAHDIVTALALHAFVAGGASCRT